MQYMIPFILLIYFIAEGIESLLPDSFITKYPNLSMDISLFLVFGSIILFIILGIVGHLLPIFQTSKIWFGKYKGEKWINLPDSYLRWVSSNFNDHNKRFALKELERRSKEKVSKNTQIKEPIEDYENTVIGIITANRICWKCKKSTKVIALKFYANMNGNSSYSKKPKVEHYIKKLDPYILNQIQSKYPSFQYRFSKSINSSYLGNCCTHCNMLQGDFQLHQEIDGPFIDSYKMKCIEYLVLNNGQLEFSKKVK